MMDEQGELQQAGTPPPATWVLVVPLRLFLAAGWLRAAAEKVVDGRWLHGDGVRSFLGTERPRALPFARPAMDKLLQPCAILVAVVVLVAEILCCLAIASGRWLRAGLWTAVALNIAFVACGRVNPSAFYLVMELILLFAIAEGTVGRGVRRTPVTTPVATVTTVAPVVALVATSAGLAMLPFIRTLEPADVIADPAAMLAFLGLIVGLASAVRWASTQSVGTPPQRFASRVISWSQSRQPWVAPGVARAALPFAPPRQQPGHPLLRSPTADELMSRLPSMSTEGSPAST